MSETARPHTCQNCGEFFVPSKGTDGAFCSRECAGEGGGGQIKPYAPYSALDRGYTIWSGSNTVDGSFQVYVHRLLAVSEYGFDAVRDNIVHHRNGVRWDNRVENIEVMSQSDHVRQHHSKLEGADRREAVELYLNTDMTQKEVGELYGVDGSQISRAKQEYQSDKKAEEIKEGGHE